MGHPFLKNRMWFWVLGSVLGEEEERRFLCLSLDGDVDGLESGPPSKTSMAGGGIREMANPITSPGPKPSPPHPSSRREQWIRDP
eukprot:CAMPEP_0171295968 /NCGR_PEP_ID=MMETSP0816-20121228/4635_1 /TAXON_ID=420281 /ORGANISM="Proboscia inermis, Strain CCAP1064/1" /LENGTH=84 /DNA_ID=CAMNT_0011769057 /DNA_START=610 /DNA_END=864 /DNA_ORIENTATION=+